MGSYFVPKHLLVMMEIASSNIVANGVVVRGGSQAR